MASIAGLGKIGLPRLSENMDPEDARALRNYLYEMLSLIHISEPTRH